MVGNIEKTCNNCLKTMHSDHLKRHIEAHQVVGNTGMMKIDKEAIDKVLIRQHEEFKMKLELGTIINDFMEKNELESAALSMDELEALEIYENYGKKQNLEKTTWRGWQIELLRYLDQPSQRQVIWVIGESGNEGK